MVWVMGLCKSLLYNARIGYENTDMRELSLCHAKRTMRLIVMTAQKSQRSSSGTKGLVCDAHQDRHGAMPGERAERHSLAQKRALLLARQAHLAVGHELEICAQIFPCSAFGRGSYAHSTQCRMRVSRASKRKEHDAVLVRDFASDNVRMLMPSTQCGNLANCASYCQSFAK